MFKALWLLFQPLLLAVAFDSCFLLLPFAITFYCYLLPLLFAVALCRCLLPLPFTVAFCRCLLPLLFAVTFSRYLSLLPFAVTFVRCFLPLPLAVAFCPCLLLLPDFGCCLWRYLLTLSFGIVFRQCLFLPLFACIRYFFIYTTLSSILALNIAALLYFRQRCSFDYLCQPIFVVL